MPCAIVYIYGKMRFRSVLLLPLLLFPVFFAIAQTGKIMEYESFRSSILPHNVNYGVYLPPDYETSNRTYPIVYLLHGYTDDHTAWVQFGEVNRYVDKAIAEGIIPPMIIVMPDADSSWYMNTADGKERYEDFFIKEFLPGIEKKYRVKSQKRFRGIAGLSMGGFGSLLYSLKHPELFAAAAPLSAAVWDDSSFARLPQSGWNIPFGVIYGKDLQGGNRLTKHWYENSILELVAKSPIDRLKSVRYWIDCGDDDFLIKGNCLLHIALTERSIPHEFRVRDGAHTWGYWRTGITDALAFIGESFHQK